MFTICLIIRVVLDLFWQESPNVSVSRVEGWEVKSILILLRQTRKQTVLSQHLPSACILRFIKLHQRWNIKEYVAAAPNPKFLKNTAVWDLQMPPWCTEWITVIGKWKLEEKKLKRETFSSFNKCKWRGTFTACFHCYFKASNRLRQINHLILT